MGQAAFTRLLSTFLPTKVSCNCLQVTDFCPDPWNSLCKKSIPNPLQSVFEVLVLTNPVVAGDLVRGSSPFVEISKSHLDLCDK